MQNNLTFFQAPRKIYGKMSAVLKTRQTVQNNSLGVFLTTVWHQQISSRKTKETSLEQERKQDPSIEPAGQQVADWFNSLDI